MKSLCSFKNLHFVALAVFVGAEVHGKRDGGKANEDVDNPFYLRP